MCFLSLIPFLGCLVHSFAQKTSTPSGTYILPSFSSPRLPAVSELIEVLCNPKQRLEVEGVRNKKEYQGLGSLDGWGLCNREDHLYCCSSYRCRTAVFRMWPENLLSPHEPPFPNCMSVRDWISTKTSPQIECRSRYENPAAFC